MDHCWKILVQILSDNYGTWLYTPCHDKVLQWRRKMCFKQRVLALCWGQQEMAHTCYYQVSWLMVIPLTACKSVWVCCHLRPQLAYKVSMLKTCSKKQFVCSLLQLQPRVTGLLCSYVRKASFYEHDLTLCLLFKNSEWSTEEDIEQEI